MRGLFRRLTEFACLAMLAAPGVVQAQVAGEAFLQPITGVGLLQSVLHGARPAYYDASDAAPNWRIAQWNMPGGQLAPLRSQTEANGDTLLTTSSAEASVAITLGKSAAQVVLKQDGSVLPCDNASNHPRESDLFFSPGGFGEPKPGVTGLTAAASAAPPLASLQRLVFSTSLAVQEGRAARPKGCPVTQGGALIGVTLVDHAGAKPQTLFYQLQFDRICAETDPSRQAMCTHVADQPAYWSQKNPFGGGDVLGGLGQSMLVSNQPRQLQVDLLPRLKLLIADGPPALDKDLSHWSVGNIYLGQHIWGDAALTSQWSDFSLTAYPG